MDGNKVRVLIYDTTLRDGAQGEGISLTVEDKLKITRKLDELGVAYVEGGWPGSNPKDIEYFQRVRSLPLHHARLAAFGSTRRAGIGVEEDANIRALLAADTPCVAIVGKTWDFHVLTALQTTLEENLDMIRDSVGYLKAHGREVVFDAEHFFDGFKANRDYALATLKAAAAAGADWIVLCDTNGGSLTFEIEEICGQIGAVYRHPVGHSYPQRRGVGGGQQYRRRAMRGADGPGHHQRLRGAVRQRQPVLGDPQPAAQAGLLTASSPELLQAPDRDLPLRGRDRQHGSPHPAVLRGSERLCPQGGHSRQRHLKDISPPTSTSIRRWWATTGAYWCRS